MLDWLAGQSFRGGRGQWVQRAYASQGSGRRAQGIGPERQGPQDVVPTEPHLARG